jgi:hypothetical protein
VIVRRFVILATLRTGSNYLCGLLNSHPDIRCYTALLSSRFDVQHNAPGIDERYADLDYRRAHAFDYIETIETATPDVPVMGFKLMLVQDRRLRLLRRLAVERSYNVLLLSRDNLLAKFASAHLARKTGQGVALQGQAVARDTVHFDGASFLDYTRGVEKRYRKARRVLRQLNRPFLKLEYCQLGDETLHERMTDFLGLAYVPLSSRHKKRNPSRIIERFDNPAEVRRFLERHELLHWAEEDAGAG